jgi:hypothetical protein
VISTTDGGTTWTRLADLPDLATGESPKIRFADNQHGFIMGARGGDRTLLGTDDGGVHWRVIEMPAGPVQELEIARGVVYVVTWNGNSEPAEGFHVWSSPADHLTWTKDPLVLPLGAGPVPEQQLVFAGGDGWLLNSDRELLGGARLSGTRRWATWTPPCGGFATFAASTRTDLVALCDENGFAGPGPPKPVLYSSHDGGVTFHHHRAPAYGAVSAPTPTTVVIATGLVLWRTTNDGATWKIVTDLGEGGGGSALELGFTTASQGFIIQRLGGLYITRDSGATWNHVTIP